MTHKHSVYDTDAHLTIVPALRRIIGAENIRLVRGDHNSTRVTFDMPRFVDGHDMAETSIVEIHYINISTDAKNTNEDVYIASDVQISPDSDDVVIFSWLISGNATKYDGTLSFMLCFKCLTGEALDYSWRTEIVKGVPILASLDCVAAAVEDITDILTVWEMKIADLQGRVRMLERVDSSLQNQIDEKLFFVDFDEQALSIPGRWADLPNRLLRVMKVHGTYWMIEHTGGVDDGEGSAPATLHYVDALPEVGLPFGGSMPLNIYKKNGDDKFYRYQQNGEWDEVHPLFQIVESYEEIKGAVAAVAFVPESTECKIYAIDNSNPFGAGLVELTDGGSGGSIISVASLPESDIDTKSIYRLGDFATVYIKNADGSISTNIFNGIPVKVYIVDELPAVGEPFIDNTNAPTRGVAYYCKADKELYLYSGAWVKFSDAVGAWQKVDSIDGVTSEGIAYICLPTNKGFFYYDGEWHELVDKAELEGALDGKLDKVTSTSTFDRAYIVTGEGTQSATMISSKYVTANSLVKRTSTGAIVTAPPTADNQATPKVYVDSKLGKTTEVLWSEVDGGEYIVTDGEYVFGFDATPSNGCVRYNGSFDSVFWRGQHASITVSGDEKGWFENGVILSFNDLLLDNQAIIKFRELPCLHGPQTLLIEVIL